MPGSLPDQSQQMYSSQQSQYYTHANAIPTLQELNNDRNKVSYKWGIAIQDETERETKYSTESVHWLNQTSTSDRYTALLKEESENQQHKAGPENTPKPPPKYISHVKNISPLIQLLEKIAKQQYGIKVLQELG
jgi:hypothetical protein